MTPYDWKADAIGSFEVAIAALRAELERRVAAGEDPDAVKADQLRRFARVAHLCSDKPVSGGE